MLRDRFEKDDLLNLDNILLAFVRPRNQDEWTLAYCQSHLYVEYLIKTYGIESVGPMLNAFRDGLDTGGGAQKVCKVDKDAFEKGYRAYVAEVVKSIPSAGKKAGREADDAGRAGEGPREGPGRRGRRGPAGRPVLAPQARPPTPASWPRRCWRRSRATRWRRSSRPGCCPPAGDEDGSQAGDRGGVQGEPGRPEADARPRPDGDGGEGLDQGRRDVRTRPQARPARRRLAAAA